MKRIGLFAVLVLGAALTVTHVANAQDSAPKAKGKGTAQSVEQQMERMTKQLTLTEAQKPKVKAVLEETRKKRQALTEDTSVTGRDRREKMTALVEEQEKKLKAILTPEQFTAYQKAREEARAKGKNRPEGEQGKRKQQ